MSDRIRGFVVTLRHDAKDEYAEATRLAILQLKNVASVKPVVADLEMHMATERARGELRDKIMDILLGPIARVTVGGEDR